LDRKRGTKSAYQKILSYQQFTHMGQIGSLDRLGWRVDEISQYLVFDWVHGDGLNPDTGPTLAFRGTAADSGGAPWLDRKLVSQDYTRFNLGQYYTATAVDPTLTQDIVVAFLVKRNTASDFTFPYGTIRWAGGTRGHTANFSGNFCQLQVYGDASISMPVPFPFGGWALLGFSLDRGGNIKTYKNGNHISTHACPAGALGEGNGIALNGLPDNNNKALVGLFRLMIWHGVGLFDLVDDNWWKRLGNSVLGIDGIDVSDYACNSLSSCSDGTKYHFFDGDTIRSGMADGFLLEPAITNKCYRNVAPAATTGWTASGGSFTVVADASDLNTAGLFDFGPNVFSLANSSGSDQYVYGGAQTGNTNDHSLSIFARYTAGSGARIGLRDVSAGTFQDLGAISDSYARTAVEKQTPSDTDMQFCIKIPDGCTLLFIGQQLEEYDICTTPIPSIATGASAARARTVHSGVSLPDDNKGLIEVEIKSEGWSGNALQSSDFVAASSSGGKYLYIPSAGSSDLQIFDGVNNAAVGSALSGSEQVVRSGWGDRLDIDVEGVGSDTDTYDGGMNGSGTIGVGGANTPPFWIKRFMVGKNQ
jgi:hypothetical protein